VSEQHILPAGWHGRLLSPRAPRIPPGRLLAAAFLLALLIADAVVAVNLSKASDWQPASVVLLLLSVAIVSELGTAAMHGVRVSCTLLAVVLATVLLGPVPAALIGLVPVGVESVLRGVRGLLLLNNLASYATLPLVLGWAIELSIGPDPAALSGTAAALLVLVASLVCGLVSFLLVTLQFAPFSPRGLWSLLRRIYLPVQPYWIVAAAIAAAAAHAQRTLGLLAMAACLAILLASELLLRAVTAAHARADAIAQLNVERSRLLGEALTVEERERQRLAAYLHDEPLQLLVAAQQELQEARAGSAEAIELAARHIGDAVGDLRQTIAHVHPLPLEQVGLGALLPAVTRQLCRGRLESSVCIEPTLCVVDDGLVYSLARELVTNVVKHAEAGRLELTLGAREGRVVLQVADDGVGFDQAAVPVDGHVGLALAAHRARAAGGELTVESAPGGGTRVRVCLPQTRRASP
jgi:signal transduction histidine kinase